MADPDNHIAVIGGGVIGAMCAWYLLEKGFRVTIIERDKFGAACSHANCGYVSPSHVLPLTQPGAIKNALSGLFSRNSPFSVRPTASPALWNWLWRFSRRCNERDMMLAAKGRHELLQMSKQLYKDLISAERLDVEWEELGILFVFATRKGFDHYEHIEKKIRENFGVAATPYDPKRLVELEPALKDGLGGAWHYQGDCHLRPDKLMSEMRRRLTERGVEIVEKFEVKRFQRENGIARAVTNDRDLIEADQFVVATGAWTPFLNKHLGCNIPIQPGKGYSLTMPHPKKCPRIPLIFEEHRVAITPMATKYRIGSTMEFAGYDTSINPKRLGLLRSAAEHYLHTPHCEPVEETWYGWRPMTWDGLPIIDRSPASNNVLIAAGHNMLGVSMATGTGRLISILATGDPLDTNQYGIGRF